MRFIITTLAMVLLSATSCKTARTQTTEENKKVEKNEVVEQSVADENLCRIRVTLGSVASGINRNAKIAFEKYVGEYETQTGKKLAHEIVLWGMEGERDYCFKLTELNKKEQAQFISGLQEVAQANQQLFLVENIESRKPRQAPPGY